MGFRSCPLCSITLLYSSKHNSSISRKPSKFQSRFRLDLHVDATIVQLNPILFSAKRIIQSHAIDLNLAAQYPRNPGLIIMEYRNAGIGMARWLDCRLLLWRVRLTSIDMGICSQCKLLSLLSFVIRDPSTRSVPVFASGVLQVCLRCASDLNPTME